ncbi:MAG: HEPN domain-containing protein, partial [Campylobacterota bacterium]
KDMKTYLKNIVIRRNQIVHESDYNIFSNTKNTINENETKNIVEFIQVLGKSIYEYVNNQSLLN